MPLTDKEIEQRVKAFEYGGYGSVLAHMDGSILTWGDDAQLIDMSLQTLFRFVDRIEASFPILAKELRKIDAEYMANTCV